MLKPGTEVKILDSNGSLMQVGDIGKIVERRVDYSAEVYAVKDQKGSVWVFRIDLLETVRLEPGTRVKVLNIPDVSDCILTRDVGQIAVIVGNNDAYVKDYQNGYTIRMESGLGTWACFYDDVEPVTNIYEDLPEEWRQAVDHIKE